MGFRMLAMCTNCKTGRTEKLSECSVLGLREDVGIWSPTKVIPTCICYSCLAKRSLVMFLSRMLANHRRTRMCVYPETLTPIVQSMLF